MPEAFHVRPASPGDEPTLRALRIEALTDSPEAFGSTLERELSRSTADWTSWLSPYPPYFLESAAGAVGIAAGVPDPADPEVVQLMSMWVHPDYRGLGGADLLVEAVVSRARELGATRVELDVIQGNGRAQRFYERLQFRLTGHSAVRERDGSVELRMARVLVPGSSG